MSAQAALTMTSGERRATAALAGIFALRMFGLFLILPVFAVYARTLPEATAVTIGLALGIYGASQALLQIPFGFASDRLGRKPVITFGLLVFAVGSIVAANADSMAWIIVGRALQGAGAVAAAVLALTADLTRDAVRTRAMAAIGISIGGSFMLALMVGPALTPWIGVPGLFWLTAVLSVGAIAMLWLVVPQAPVVPRPSARGALGRVLADMTLWRLNIGIFILHVMLMALFVVIPGELVDRHAVVIEGHWKIYVPVLLASIPALAILVRMSHGGGGTRKAFVISMGLLIVSQLLLATGGASFLVLVAALVCFFSGFNALEAMLPSLVSRVAQPDVKGTALGLFNTCEFLGIFVGGLGGGLLLSRYGPVGVYWMLAALVVIWLIVFVTGADPAAAVRANEQAPVVPTRSIELRIGPRTPAEAESLRARLAGYDGVANVIVNPIEGLAHLTVETGRFDMRLLDEFAETVNIRLGD